MTIKNLVFAGAQAKGYAYLGVYKALIDLDLLKGIMNICGVSSGSMMALLICIELDYMTCKNILYKIVTFENLKTFKSNEIFNILETYGLETGENIKKIIYFVLDKQTGNRHCTFKELNDIFPSKKLIIVGANITTGQSEFFSVDTTPDMEIYDAVRISISIPFVFTSVKYNNLIYGDGGLINNFPIDYFNDDLEHTVGCCVSFLGDYTDITSFTSYIGRVFSIMCNYGRDIIFERYSDNIIDIVVPHISIIDILTIDKHKTTFINSGYNQFIKKIKKLPIYKTISHKFIIKDILDNIIENILIE